MELQKPISGIFFDLGWTLLYPPSGSWMFSRFARTYFSEEAMGALPKERVNTALREGQAYLDAKHLLSLSTTEEEYAQFLHYFTLLAEALPELGLSEADVKKVTEDKVYNIADNYGLLPGALETLEALKGNYRLGVISDTWPSIVPVLEHFGLLPCFDCVTYSYALGAVKPDAKMYRDALGKMGLPPRETVFIDDSAENLRGARAQGIQPVLIRAKPDADSDDTMAGIETVSGLLALL